MDGWGIAIFAVSAILYFVTKKKPFFLLTAGIGIGIVIGAIWANIIIQNSLNPFLQ